VRAVEGTAAVAVGTVARIAGIGIDAIAIASAG
jgi:hypothetical protein